MVERLGPDEARTVRADAAALRVFAGILAVLLVVADVACVYYLVAFNHRHALALEVVHGHRRDITVYDANDRSAHLAAQLVIFAFAAAFIAFLLWFHRCALIATRAGAEQRWSTRWAYGAWFIPLANFVIPGQIAVDVWEAGRPYTSRGHPARIWAVAVWSLLLVGDVGAHELHHHPLETPQQVVDLSVGQSAYVASLLSAATLTLAFSLAQTRRLLALVAAPDYGRPAHMLANPGERRHISRVRRDQHVGEVVRVHEVADADVTSEANACSAALSTYDGARTDVVATTMREHSYVGRTTVVCVAERSDHGTSSGSVHR